MHQEQQRLSQVVRHELSHSDSQALLSLITETDAMYGITRLKQMPKDFSQGQIKGEIQRAVAMKPLYASAQKVLPRLDISNESIKYYASLVDYYSVFRLTQLDPLIVQVYLLCFVLYRYCKLHDHLITALIHHVKGYLDEAKQAAKDRVYDSRLEQNRNLAKAGQLLKLFTDPIAPQTPFETVQAQAFMILERPQLDRLATYLSFHAQFDEVAFQWEYIDQISRRFKRQLRPLLRHVEWMAWSGQQPFLWAVHCLKQIFEKKRSLTSAPLEDIPTDFIPDSLKQYLYTTPSQTSKKLLVDRYEFLVYRVLRDGIEAGHLFCRDSVRYRSLEDDLVDPVRWQSKESLLVQAGLSALTAPIEVHFMALEQNLEERLTVINQHIISGQNQHFQFKKRGQPRWTLSQPHDDERLNHSFFDPFPHVDLNTLLHFTHQHCHFMNVFEHILRRYRKTETDERVLTACLIAWGTNMGLGRMGAISDIPYPALATASHLFIRLETLQIANDLISNAIAKLPIFHYYDLGNTLHSSSDGQRFETRLSTFNARYSSKYFGLKKGVIAYTLVANHIPIHAHLISADEHESHYVFDILSSNTTDLHPTIHSTDTHGTNEVNFAILSCFGYHFAPRYRDIYDKVTHSLYGFQHPSAYDPAWPLRPLRKVNTALIVDQWDHIQRIMLSLALKTTTQSIIVRKLSSHARRNKTQQALWEYDHILRSLYLLDYIDSLSLRRHVQSALNRGENYHQLRRAVSYANFGRLRFKTEAEQHLWLECSRLITNCIIFYNASLLSNVLRFKEEQADPQQIAQLKHVSPIAWQHINFYGRYSFATQPPLIDVSSLVQPLANLTIEPYPID